jgi:hypothetical protein
MDNKEYWQKIIEELAHLNRTLDKFLKIANRPGKQGPQSEEDTHAAEEKSEPAERGVMAQLHLGPSPEHRPNSKAKWYSSTEWWKSKTFEWWKRRIEVVGIIFAMGYAIITYFQWRDAHRNFITDERAWLQIKRAGEQKPGESSIPVFQLSAGELARVPLELVNIGKTPGRNGRTAFNVEILRYDEEPHIECLVTGCKGVKTATLPIFFPNERDTYPTWSQNIATEEDAANWTTGDTYIAVYGIVSYDDVFGTQRWTKFCYWGAHVMNKNYKASKCTLYNEVK